MKPWDQWRQDNPKPDFRSFMDPAINWIRPSSFDAAFDKLIGSTAMTTKVTIDAHAGWPVLVVTKVGEAASAKSYTTHRVEPYTQQDFYIHSGCAIVDITECSDSWVAKKDVAETIPAGYEALNAAETHGDGA